MKFERWLSGLILENRGLGYKLNIVFGLFFLFPVLGFILFAIKYGILQDRYLPLFFLGVLAFSLFGFLILRKLFDQIRKISTSISESALNKAKGPGVEKGEDELQNIVKSFNVIEDQFSHTLGQLEKRMSEVSILKEVSELCYVTFDPEEILYVTLERALMLMDADMGSIFILERPGRKAFIVKASIGLGEVVKLGDRIDFETSIAKYAVLNKSPIVIDDIEKDKRFGRTNRAQYGSHSFVCMPIKTSRDILGVLTIARKKEARPFMRKEVDVLTPLLSNAAFTYENLRLMKAHERNQAYLKSIDKIFKVISSSFKDSELWHAFLYEVQTAVAFDLAFILTREDSRVAQATVLEAMSNAPTAISKGTSFPFETTVIDKVFKQGTALLIEDTARLSTTEEMIFEMYRSCFLAPLKMDGIVKGVLVLCSDNAALFAGTQELVEWMANGLSMAIDRSALTADVVKRAKDLDTIKQIGGALASSTFDINRVLKYTMEMIRKVMNVEAGSLLFLKGDELELAVSFEIEVTSLKHFGLKLGQGIAGYTAARGKSIVVNNIEDSRHFLSDVDDPTGFKTRSAMCVPMISQGKVIGVIEVLNKIDGDFTVADEHLLQSIASSVSIAIENARLYKETVAMAEHERGIRNVFQKFVPKEIVDQIIHGSETGEAVIEEVKTLTLLNVDIRGFSVLTKEIGPQKAVSLLNHFFETMGNIIFEYGGIVDKYLGDGLLALFGAPVSSTMDADNAVLAALEMKKAIGDVNTHFVRELGTSVNIGISVHTGEVVVGNFGFERKMDYTVIGDAVNGVFHLQELTKTYPNGILISENTLRATRSPFEACDTGNRCVVNGAAWGFKIYELLGRKRSNVLDDVNVPLKCA